MSTAVAGTALATFFDRPLDEITADPSAPERIVELLDGLDAGVIRAAEPVQADTSDERGDGTVSWRVNGWVKHGILATFRLSDLVEWPHWPGSAVDKDALPARHFTLADQVRIVPGGSAIRRGAYLAPGTVVMPPAYVNIGGYVGSGTMIDSHALVGSCAQIGAKVHLSAAAQVGGVLEPVGARPVIIEDGAFIGAQVGLFEGVLIRRGAVLAPGTIISASTTVYDLVNGRTLSGEIPAGAVVVPGSRPARGDFAAQHGISLSAPCIVKYRDAGTDAATTLEEALR